MANSGVWLALAILVLIATVIIIASGIRIIQPYQKGLAIVLGEYRGVLDPGFHLVMPMVTNVVIMDTRLQTMDIPKREVLTKDKSVANVSAVVYIKVVDPYKAYYEVQNYRHASVLLIQNTLQMITNEIELDELIREKITINVRLRDILNETMADWGVFAEAVEIRKIEVIREPKVSDYEKHYPIRVTEMNRSEMAI